MKYLIHFIILLLIFIMAGCSAHVEYDPGIDSKYAPINAKNQYGLISYISDGADYIVE